MTDYQWRGPLKAAIAKQATDALIDPELLLYTTQSPHGADGRVQATIDRDLLGLCPPVEGRGHRDKPKCQEARNAHARRRAEYASIQSLYRKSRTACARTVLAGHWRGTSPVLPLAQQTAYWKPLFETISTKESRVPSGARPMWDIVRPFSNEEVARSLRAMKDGAPGPDQITKERILLLPVAQLTCRFNIWLLLGVAPDSFRNGVTVLIPKSGDAVEPAQFRPITIGPILCRLFHRILAQRIEASYSISERQKAFRKGDGIADNTYILRYVLADRKARCQPISVAFLDVAKAFDSVSHESLFLAVSNAGIPEPLVVYIRSLYAGSRTRLRVSGGLSDKIMIKRGVRQGDPLSPVLFNAIIDMCIQHIDSNIGVPVGDQTLSCLAFADDLVLLAKSPRGLQHTFTTIERALTLCGLSTNAKKCNTLRIDVLGGAKTWACNPTAFLADRSGGLIKALGITEGYRYLGNTVSVGVSSNTVLETLEDGLRQLTRAPLKPQQRMSILRCNLLPSLLHQAVLGRISRKTLKYMDTCTRAAVRSWLRLPRDTPMPYFHADYRDGGLTVAKLNLVVPLHRTKRMARLTGSLDPIVRGVSALPAFIRDVRRWSAPISAFGCPIRDGVSMRNALAHGLHTSVDGRGLSDSRSVGFVNRWMVNGTSLMSGRSFINCVSMKGNLIHTALRASRGRPQASTRCDACTATESLGHILQVCRRTHDSRVARHDGVNALLSGRLKAKGYATAIEPISRPGGQQTRGLRGH